MDAAQVCIWQFVLPSVTALCNLVAVKIRMRALIMSPSSSPLNRIIWRHLLLLLLILLFSLTPLLSTPFVAATDGLEGKENEGGTVWATAEQEALDERQDADIFKAVVTSISEWENRRRRRRTIKPDNSSKRSKRSDSRVCYQHVGCFQEAGYIDMLPNSPDEVNTRFLLYNSKKSRGDTPLIDVSAQNITSLWEWADKAFNTSAPTKIIIHGFGSSCSNVWVYEMRSALMSVEECNIICVDWEAGATIPNYVRAAANTRLVGKQVAMLISGLEEKVNVSSSNIHMIGFSLGAHVAGFAGSEVKNLSRITGLDPAGPLFESQDRRARLDSMDANFVDVIHSNGENLILGGLGSWQPMGHVDFYPNGGRMQKGCTNLFVGAVSDMIWSDNEVYGRSLCNHRRAYKFFTDSVSSRCQFPAVSCESYDHYIEGKCFPCKEGDKCGNMGFYADKHSGRGTLYLLTRDEEPFCAHQYMIKIDHTPSTDANLGKRITYGKIQVMLIGDLELNETFVITQKKDEKLTSGESLSRIIVPHPALQNFFKIQILYVAYNGWLSSGLPHWYIDKLSLTNSYNQKLSVCKAGGLMLESGVAVVLPLGIDDCDTDTNDSLAIPQNVTPHHNNRNDSASIDGYTLWTQVVQIGDEILHNHKMRNKTEQNSTSQVTETPDEEVAGYFNNSWEPVVDTSVPELYSHRKKYIENTRYSVDQATDNLQMTNIAANIFIQNKTTPSSPIVKCPVEKMQKILDTKFENAKCVYQEETRPFFDSVTASQTYGESDENNKKTTIIITDSKTKNNTYSKNKTSNETEYAVTAFEIEEPVLKPKSHNTLQPQQKQPELARSYSSKSIKIEGVSTKNESVLQQQTNPTSAAFKDAWNFISFTNATTNISKNASDVEKQSFVIQFLPHKLASFIGQAEYYAKLALSPFTNADSKSTNERLRRRLHITSPIVSTRERKEIEEKPEKYFTNWNTKNHDLDISETENSYRKVAIVPMPYTPPAANQAHGKKYIPFVFEESEDSDTQPKLKLSKTVPKQQLDDLYQEYKEPFTFTDDAFHRMN